MEFQNLDENMANILYFDRKAQKLEKEKVYGGFFLELLYGEGWISRCFSFFFLPLFTRFSCFSKFYGFLQKTRLSRFKVMPFIRKFQVDSSEFLEPASSFASFNEFFIRRLKPSARSIVSDQNVAILPADARYLVYPKIQCADDFWVKGKKFSLQTLLNDQKMASRYEKGAMAIARLCPSDYHRFHFPVACVPGEPRLIEGPLYSVNPLALKRHSEILCENKRMITELKTDSFGTILYIEVGATYVGTIHQTYVPGRPYAKGEEKGYFSFGGSSLILLFEPNTVLFDEDLLTNSNQKIEVRGLLGESMGSKS